MGTLVDKLITPYLKATAGPLMLQEQPAIYGKRVYYEYDIKETDGQAWGGKTSLESDTLIRFVHGDSWSLGSSVGVGGNLSMVGKNRWTTMEMRGGIFLEWENALAIVHGVVSNHEAHGLEFQGYVPLQNSFALSLGLLAMNESRPAGIVASEDRANDQTIRLSIFHFNFGLAYFF